MEERENANEWVRDKGDINIVKTRGRKRGQKEEN